VTSNQLQTTTEAATAKQAGERLGIRFGPVVYSIAWGALGYGFVDQLAGGQTGPAWISGTLLALSAAAGVWNVVGRMS
jgi:hypothetical protein